MVNYKGAAMATVDISYSKALKIWWSYIWRMAVLLAPAAIVAWSTMLWFLPLPRPGQPVQVWEPSARVAAVFTLWLCLMAASVLLQVQAMRWMLKTKWRDFRLQVTRPD